MLNVVILNVAAPALVRFLGSSFQLTKIENDSARSGFSFSGIDRNSLPGVGVGVGDDVEEVDDA
jgi:hypothetical protein